MSAGYCHSNGCLHWCGHFQRNHHCHVKGRGCLHPPRWFSLQQLPCNVPQGGHQRPRPQGETVSKVATIGRIELSLICSSLSFPSYVASEDVSCVAWSFHCWQEIYIWIKFDIISTPLWKQDNSLACPCSILACHHTGTEQQHIERLHLFKVVGVSCWAALGWQDVILKKVNTSSDVNVVDCHMFTGKSCTFLMGWTFLLYFYNVALNVP